MHYIGNQPSSGPATVTVADGSITLAKLDRTGTAGLVLTANGVGTAPTWQTPASNAVPPGAVMGFAGAAAPPGWLLCDGSAVSRTTYAALFAAISTTYGVGNGSTTFNLPDARGRVLAGVDNMGGTAAGRLTGQSGGVSGTLGATGGSQSHALTVAEMASHQHLLVANVTTSTSSPTITSSQYIVERNDPNSNQTYDINGTSSVATSGLSSSVGSNAAHNNVQPTLVVNMIIKT